MHSTCTLYMAAFKLLELEGSNKMWQPFLRLLSGIERLIHVTYIEVLPYRFERSVVAGTKTMRYVNLNSLLLVVCTLTIEKSILICLPSIKRHMVDCVAYSLNSCFKVFSALSFLIQRLNHKTDFWWSRCSRRNADKF